MPVTCCLNKNGESLQPPRSRRSFLFSACGRHGHGCKSRTSSPEKSPSCTHRGGTCSTVDAGLRCDYSYIRQVLREENFMASVTLAQLKSSSESPWLNYLIFGIDPTENGLRDLRGGTLTGL